MNSNRAMTPTMMVSIVVLKLFAEADVKTADNEKHDDNSDTDQVIHNHSQRSWKLLPIDVGWCRLRFTFVRFLNTGSALDVIRRLD
jgi:hypothetical protein